MEKINIASPAQSGLVLDFIEDEGGNVAFRIASDQSLITDMFNITLAPEEGRLGLVNADGGPITWRTMDVAGRKVQYIPSQEVDNPTLQLGVQFASKAAPREEAMMMVGWSREKNGQFIEPPEDEKGDPLPIYNALLGDLLQFVLPE